MRITTRRPGSDRRLQQADKTSHAYVTQLKPTSRRAGVWANEIDEQINQALERCHQQRLEAATHGRLTFEGDRIIPTPPEHSREYPMKADIGWLMGHIRISDRPGFKHGDHDWQEIVTLTVAIDGVAELSGLRSEHWKVAHRSAVGRLLWQLGFKRVRWARHLPGGEEHIVEFGLERFAGQACNS